VRVNFKSIIEPLVRAGLRLKKGGLEF